MLWFSSNMQNTYRSIWFGALLKKYIFTIHHNNITYLIPAHETIHLPPEERGYISTDLHTYSTYADYMYTSYCRAPSGAPSNRVSVPRAFTWRFMLGSQSLIYTASRACSFRLFAHLHRTVVLSTMSCRERRVLCVSLRCLLGPHPVSAW